MSDEQMEAPTTAIDEVTQCLSWAIGYINAMSITDGLERSRNAHDAAVLQWLDRADAALAALAASEVGK